MKLSESDKKEFVQGFGTICALLLLTSQLIQSRIKFPLISSPWIYLEFHENSMYFPLTQTYFSQKKRNFFIR